MTKSYPPSCCWLYVLAIACVIGRGGACNYTLTAGNPWNTTVQAQLDADMSGSEFVFCLEATTFTGCGEGVSLITGGGGPVRVVGLSGGGVPRPTINCGGSGRAVYTTDAIADARIENVRIINGESPLSGSENGGCVWFGGESFVVSNSRFEGCVANNNGGAMYLSGAVSARVVNTTVSDSTAIFGGAAYLNSWSNMVLVDSTFRDNVADQDGGAVLVSGATLVVNDSCVLSDNTASRGGALYVDSLSNVTLSGASITDNSAGEGSAVATTTQVDVSLTDCVVAGNGGGAAIVGVSGEQVSVVSCTVECNSAASGTAVAEFADFTDSTTITNNYILAGGVYEVSLPINSVGWTETADQDPRVCPGAPTYCDYSPCSNNATCTDATLFSDGRSCDCPSGLSGDVCDCGDGELDTGEECDDGNDDDGDGCSDACEIETGFECNGTCATCESHCESVCGDGYIAGAEECDDGNDDNWDGCSDNCNDEPNFVCSTVNGRTVCASCGDGVVQSALEECDDANSNNGDGCSEECKIEAGYTCESECDTCVSKCSTRFVAAAYIVVIGVAVAFVVVALICCALNCYLPATRHFSLLLMIMSVANVATDVLFTTALAVGLRNAGEALLSVVCVISLCVTFAVNCGGVTFFFWSERQGENGHRFSRWMGGHRFTTGCFVFFSVLNLGVLRGINANLFNSEAFRAPLSRNGRVRSATLGLLTNLTEDLPFVIVQGIYIAGTARFGVTVLTTISFAFTIFAIVSSLGALLINFLRSWGDSVEPTTEPEKAMSTVSGESASSKGASNSSSSGSYYESATGSESGRSSASDVESSSG